MIGIPGIVITIVEAQIEYVYDNSGNMTSKAVTMLYPEISAVPSSVNFGYVNTGTASDPMTITIGNLGTADLIINTISLTGTDAGQFGIQSDNCSNTTINPSGTCQVNVVLTPQTGGPKQAMLAITSNDADTPSIDMALSGTGISTLTVSVAPASGGTVTGTTINCPDTCTGTYSAAGTTEQLTATPNTGYYFVNWSGDTSGSNNPEDILMDVNKSVTAKFSINTYTISTTAGPNGSVSCNPNPVWNTIQARPARSAQIQATAYIL